MINRQRLRHVPGACRDSNYCTRSQAPQALRKVRSARLCEAVVDARPLAPWQTSGASLSWPPHAPRLRYRFDPLNGRRSAPVSARLRWSRAGKPHAHRSNFAPFMSPAHRPAGGGSLHFRDGWGHPFIYGLPRLRSISAFMSLTLSAAAFQNFVIRFFRSRMPSMII